MTDFPGAAYFSNAARTNGEAKTAQDAMLAASKELLGAVAETELTIASGAVTPTAAIHKIDTEADAAADDLTNILTTNLGDAALLMVRCVDAGRVVTLKHQAGGAGQLSLLNNVDLALNSTTRRVLLVRNGTDWEEVFRPAELVFDLSPQLGASMDVNGYGIVSITNGNIPITPHGTGQVLLGATNLQDAELIRPKLKDYGETINALGGGGGTKAINLTLGNYVTATIDTSATTFTISNPPATGIAGGFTLELTDGDAQAVNYPAAVDWGDAGEPTLQSFDILVFTTIDAGTTWRAMHAYTKA